MEFDPRIPFVDLLGFELLHFDGGTSELAYDAQPRHLNSYEVVHGGVILTLMDVTMAVAARSVQKDVGVITIELKTSFMRPATGRLLATGQLLHRSRNMAFTEARVFNAQAELCAHATGTFKYKPRRAASPGDGDGDGNPGAGIATD